jgi:regulator of RNase E activity RraA
MEFIKEMWEDLSTTTISDAMSGENTMDMSLKPLNEASIAVGPACTVKLIDNDCGGVFSGLAAARRGDVLVIDTGRCMEYAFLGEIVAGMAKTIGVAGIVVDGLVRDHISIRNSGFPVFCRGSIPRVSKPLNCSKTQTDIECGGIAVHPGDIIFGDADGIVVIPPVQMADVLMKAKKKEELDQEKMARLIDNTEETTRFLQEKATKFTLD